MNNTITRYNRILHGLSRYDMKDTNVECDMYQALLAFMADGGADTGWYALCALSGRRDAARRGAAAAVLRGGAGAGVWRGRADAGLRGVFAGAPCAARGTEKQVCSCVGIGGLDLCFPGFPDTIRSKYSAPGRTAMRWEYES